MLQTWNCLAHRVGGADEDDERPGRGCFLLTLGRACRDSPVKKDWKLTSELNDFLFAIRLNYA